MHAPSAKVPCDTFCPILRRHPGAPARDRISHPCMKPQSACAMAWPTAQNRHALLQRHVSRYERLLRALVCIERVFCGSSPVTGTQGTLRVFVSARHVACLSLLARRPGRITALPKRR